MYKSPFDDISSDNERDESEAQRNAAVPPRQSALPYKLVAKQHKDFYTDEHPEIPKIRRASLKQFKNPLDEQVFGDAAPHAPFSGNLFHDARQPFNNPDIEPAQKSGEIPLYPRQARKKAQPTMAPLTGLEGADELRAWQNETGYHQSVSHSPDQRAGLPFNQLDAVEPGEAETTTHETVQPTEGIRISKIPRRRPGSGTGPTTDHTGLRRLYRVSMPLFERKKLWVILGLFTMIMLILAPVIFHSASSTSRRAGISLPGQGYNFPALPVVPSNPHELVVTPPNSDHPAPPVFATSAYLLDEDHSTTLFAQNPFLHLPMLSTTKLMTATLAVEKGNLDQQVTISPLMQQEIDQLSADSALFGIKEGETYTLRDLLYGLLYVSGNDAALVIANAVGGSVPDFVAQMNQKAQLLGMLDTHFVNPHGLLNEGQYSCAHDLAILGQYSLNISTIQQISSGKNYQIAAGGNHAARAIQNENQFLWWYPGVTGGKTGFDGVSDFVQVMSVTRNNHHMIGVVMHSINWWTDMRDLMNYGSTDYTWASPHATEAAGQPVVYDNLWNYFASDTQQDVIPMGAQGRYYVYTGYTVAGPILNYFDQQGGLPTFGFPTTMPAPSGGSKMTQHFQLGAIQCDTSNNQCSKV